MQVEWFTLFVRIGCVLCYAVYPRKYNNDLTNTYLNLVRMYAEMCHGQLCSIAENSEQSLNESRGCICSSECKANKNCCVDFYLLDILNNSIYSNVQDFVDAIMRIQLIGEISLPSELFDSLKYGKLYTCKPTTFFASEEDTVGKLMISSCGKKFRDDNLNVKCETIVRDNNLFSFQFRDLLPVTSKTTGVTFKNEHCFKCNGGKTEDAMSWNVVHETSAKYRSHIRNPYNLLKTFSYLSSFSAGDALHVWPQRHIAAKSTSCSTKQPKVCYKESTENKTYTESVYNVCVFAYSLFMKDKLFLQENSSNDVAVYSSGESCDICRSCFGHCANDYFKNKTDAVFMIFSEDAIMDIDIDINGYLALFLYGSTECKRGFISDNQKQTCRQVFCPLFWYTKNGTCVPMYSTVLNGIYNVELNCETHVSTSKGPKQDEYIAEEIAKAVSANIMQHISEKETTSVFELSIWKIPMSGDKVGTFRTYYINLRMKSDDIPFLKMLQLVSKILHNTQSYIKDEDISVSISFDRSIVSSGSIYSRTYYSVVVRQVLTLVWSNGITTPTGKFVYLGRTNFCYRMSVNILESYRTLSGLIWQIKNASILVKRYELQQAEEKDNVLDCVDNWIPLSQDFKFFGFDNKTIRQQFKANGSDESARGNLVATFDSERYALKGLWALLAVGTIIVIVVLRKYILRRTISDN